jgi:hypothetical protein
MSELHGQNWKKPLELRLISVHSEIVGVGSAQGRSEFETAGVAINVEDFK